MTIKNTKKNISAEDGEIVQNLTITTPTKANNQSNFSTNQTVTITFMDFFEEGNQPRTVSVNIPLAELVRLGYLQENYYTKAQTYSKTEIDAKVKLHYEIVSTVPTAESVRQAGKQNYIYLVPFDPDNESSNSDQLDQEGHYMEYIYTIDDNGQNERMERIGSTKLDLRPYLKISNLNSELLNANNFTTVQTQSNTNAQNITALQTSKVNVRQDTANAILVTDGNKDVTTASTIDKSKISGFSNSGQILITDSNKKISSTSSLSTSQITNLPVLSYLGFSSAANQSDINGAINTKIYNIEGSLSTIINDYELKADLKADTWGSNGFLTLQNAEANNSPNKNLKLGDYIYQHLYANFYTKTEIDTLIGTLSQLQQNTLSIL